MKKLFLAAGLALAALSAYADGVPLFTYSTAPPTAAQQEGANRFLPHRGVLSVDKIAINPAAMDSNIITATLDGKTVRFAGSLKRIDVDEVMNDGTKKTSSHDAWGGYSPDGALLSLVRHGGTRVNGSASDGKGQMYEIMASGLLIHQIHVYPNAEEIAAAKLEDAKASKDAIDRAKALNAAAGKGVTIPGVKP